MGVLESLGKAVKAGSAKLKEFNDETKQLYADYQNLSDEQLFRYARGGNIKRKMVACKVLKERGYNRIY